MARGWAQLGSKSSADDGAVLEAWQRSGSVPSEQITAAQQFLAEHGQSEKAMAMLRGVWDAAPDAVPWSDCEVAWLEADDVAMHPIRHLDCEVTAVEAATHDIRILRSKDVAVAHCPKSNAKLGCGVAPGGAVGVAVGPVAVGVAVEVGVGLAVAVGVGVDAVYSMVKTGGLALSRVSKRFAVELVDSSPSSSHPKLIDESFSHDWTSVSICAELQV